MSINSNIYGPDSRFGGRAVERTCKTKRDRPHIRWFVWISSICRFLDRLSGSVLADSGFVLAGQRSRDRDKPWRDHGPLNRGTAPWTAVDTSKLCEAEVMTWPSGGRRKGRRACPALGQTICAVCCATKRLVEIDCPDDCPHLAAAREHPAAQVKRQQERDVAVLLPSIRHLTERQHQLFFLFHSAIARHTPQGFTRLVDEDIEQAAGAVAATLETAGRGVIYEHTAATLPAQRLATDLTELLGQIRAQGGTVS